MITLVVIELVVRTQQVDLFTEQLDREVFVGVAFVQRVLFRVT